MRTPSNLDHRFYVVVANRSRALFYLRNRIGQKFELAQKLENPDGRLKAQQIESDKPGRTTRGGVPLRNGYSPHVSPEDHLMQQFVHRIAKVLDDAKAQNRFDSLVIVAGPKMLGTIRNQLEPAIERKVVFTINQDLQYLNDQEVALRLESYIKEFDQRGLAQRAG